MTHKLTYVDIYQQVKLPHPFKLAPPNIHDGWKNIGVGVGDQVGANLSDVWVDYVQRRLPWK